LGRERSHSPRLERQGSSAARATGFHAYDNPDHGTSSWHQSLFDYGPFIVIFNISGQPAISLRLAQSDTGPPIDVEIVGPYGREDLQATPGKHRPPTPASGSRSLDHQRPGPALPVTAVTGLGIVCTRQSSSTRAWSLFLAMRCR